MHILIDAILILVFLITVMHYYKVGFVKALFSVCKFFLSIVIAFSLASPLGAAISDKYIHAPVHNATSEMITSIAEDQADTVPELMNKLPGSVRRLLLPNGGIENELLPTPLNDKNIPKIINAVSDKISIIISSIIAFLIIFALSMILLTILALVLDKICTLPVLKQTNKILGVALGVIFGVFHVFMTSTVITLVLHLIDVTYPNVTVTIVKEKAVLYSLVENVDLAQIILNFFRIG